MLVKKYQAEILKIENPVDNLYVVEMRSMDREFGFNPGQFMHLSIDQYDPSAGWPESRCFSIQAKIGNRGIVFTYAAKGSYTKRMYKELKAGKTVWVKLPYGELFQADLPKNNNVFIAGGTGITPFISLFTDQSFLGYINPVLYAGFRNQRYDIYDGFIERSMTINPGFRVSRLYEDEEGKLDIVKIHQDQPPDALYFLSGPPEMIRTFRQYLISVGVNNSNIRTDDWE